MAYSDNFPATRPVFMADFANGGKIDPRATFSRASTANVFDGAKHLSSENLITYSSDVSQSYWTKERITVTGGQTAPDGGADAFKLTENTESGEHSIYQSSSGLITSSGSLTVSVHLKYIGRQWAVIRLTSPSGSRRVWFDLQNGVVGTTESEITASISASGNGYYKCVATISSVVASGTYVIIGGADADNSYVYTGSGSDAFAVWGIQASTTGETVLNETSGSIHRQYASSLVSKSNNAARFEVGTDGQSMGLLVESSSTNLFTYSHELNQWSGARNTIDQNSAVGPTGELTADTLRINDADADSHYRYQVPSVTSGTAYTLSAYVKPAGLTHFAVRFQTGFTDSMVIFNATTGAVTSNPQSLTTSATSVGNGWYRLSATATATSSASAPITIYGCDSDSTVNVATGDSYRGLLITGLQFEANSFPSSLISTSGASATRAADSLSVATADIGYTGGPLTLVADSTTETDTLNPVTFHVYKNSDHQISLNAKSDNNRAAYIEADNSYSILTSSAAANGIRALRVDTNDIATALNGTIDGTDTSQTLPDLTGATVYIGDDSNGGNSIDGHIKRVAIYNEALSDSNLQAITS